jgi:putative transcriptional regulator
MITQLSKGNLTPMAIAHHLDDATLMSLAAGSLSEAQSAVAAAHIAMCPRCARELRRMEAIGGALLAATPSNTLSKPTPSLPAASGAADVIELPRTAKARTAARAGVPDALARLIGPDLDQVPWRRLGIGVWSYSLPLSNPDGGDLRLLKIGPGRRMPDHGHGGGELTLLLRGSYRDEVGTFRIGDVADLDEDVEHRPIADPVTGCICLIASERPARFKGVIARLVQPLTGM